MKAIVCPKYGPPEVLQLQEVDSPTPKDNEVRVKILVASVNRTDVEIVRGWIFARLAGGLRKPSVKILGCDFSGRVDSIGKDVTQFQPGDEVYADLMYQKPAYGAFAEYVCIPENRLRLKPATMSFEEAATIPQAGVLAVQGIKGKTTRNPGQKVLINGAGGGVGTFAIQLAKYYGMEVTAVDSAAKFDLMQSLGADHVLDYTQEDFTKQGKHYDLILDVIARKSPLAYRRTLRPHGQYRAVGGSTGRIFQILFLGSVISRLSNKKIGLLVGKPNEKADMDLLAELYEAKQVVPIIEKTYPFAEVAAALRHLEEGRVLGKLVIKMD